MHSEGEASHTKHLEMHGSTNHPTYNENATLSQPVITSQALHWNLSTVPPTRMFWHVSGHYVFWFFCWWQLWGYFGSKRNIFFLCSKYKPRLETLKTAKSSDFILFVSPRLHSVWRKTQHEPVVGDRWGLKRWDFDGRHTQWNSRGRCKMWY